MPGTLRVPYAIDAIPKPPIALALMLLALLATIGVAPVAAGPIADRPGWSVIRSGLSYPDLIARLEAAIQSEKMGLVTRASATLGARSLGKTIPGNMVIGVFRPDFAIRMLEASVPAGIEAPIRFYVTEEPDGTATLGYKTPSAVFAPYFDDGGEKLQTLAEELDAIFAAIAAAATAPR